mgnify:CR=1 FL=1
MKIHIEYMDQFHIWHHLQTMHHYPNAYRTAANRSKSTKKRHRLIDDNNTILDIVNP